MAMRVSIIAIAPRDGWAFISNNEKLLLIRPPYDQENKIEVSIDIVAEGIDSYEFEEFGASFEKEEDLIQFVKNAYINLKKKKECPSYTSDQLIELLNYSNDEVLSLFLKEIRNEMVCKGKYLEAINMINILLQIKDIEQKSSIYPKILILKNQSEKMNELKQNWSSKFEIDPQQIDYMVIIQKRISSRKQIMPIAA